MAKTEFLQIRMTPEGRQRLSRVAEADHLDESTWARRAIFQAIERWEATEKHGHSGATDAAAGRRRLTKVAEANPTSATKPSATKARATKARARQPTGAKTKRPGKRKRSE